MSVATNVVLTWPDSSTLTSVQPQAPDFAGVAALRRAGVVGDARRLVDRLPAMLAAEGHVVDAIALGARRRGGAERDADGEQAVGVAVEAAVVDRLARAAADALDAGDRFAAALMFEVADAARGKAVDARGQRGVGGPGVGRIDLPAGPVDGDVVIGEPLELLEQETRSPADRRDRDARRRRKAAARRRLR